MKVALVSSLLAMMLVAPLASTRAFAYDPNHSEPKRSDVLPKELESVGVQEHRGQKLDANLEFKDDTGATVKLGQYFNLGRPVMMTMVYFDCPNLCTLQLNGLVDMFKKDPGNKAGRDFELVAVSMDSNETSDLAGKKKAAYMAALGQPGAEKYWHFLTGNEPNVKALAHQLGFNFKWNDSIKQFAHASATYIVTPEGAISRYIYGIEFLPATIHLSLVEASSGKIGSVVDQIALFCFQFSPSHSKYVLYAFNLVRAGAILILIILALIIVPAWRKDRKRQALGS